MIKREVEKTRKMCKPKKISRKILVIFVYVTISIFELFDTQFSCGQSIRLPIKISNIGNLVNISQLCSVSGHEEMEEKKIKTSCG